MEQVTKPVVPSSGLACRDPLYERLILLANRKVQFDKITLLDGAIAPSSQRVDDAAMVFNHTFDGDPVIVGVGRRISAPRTLVSILIVELSFL